MSSTAIDPLFQITATPPASSSPSATDADGEPFRAHLDRATETSDAKSAVEKRDAPPADDEPAVSAESESDDNETASAEQEPSAATTESSATQEDATNDGENTDQPTDEVTLSVVVETPIQQVEGETQQTLSTEVVVDASQSDGQEQQGGQAAPQSTQELVPDGQATTEVQVSASLAVAADGDAEQDESAGHSATTEVEATTPQQQLNTDASESKPDAAAQPSQTKAAPTHSPEATGDQPSLTPPAETLADDEAEVPARQSAPNSRTALESTVAKDVAIDKVAELTADASPTSSAHTENGAPTMPAPTSGDNAASAVRSLGDALAAKQTQPTSSSAEASTPETTTLDRTRFVQRVSGAIRSAQLRDGQIQLRLSPPELGTLRIQLTVSEGAITAQLETDNATARNVLLDNLPALRERLAEQEIRIEKFDVDVGRDGQQPTEQSDANERDANRRNAPSRQTASTAESESVESQQLVTPTATDSGLDVRI